MHPDNENLRNRRDRTTLSTRTKETGFSHLDRVCLCGVFADVFSGRIVGGPKSAPLETNLLPLQAPNMAARAASEDPTGPINHSERGSNYVSLKYMDAIIELVGTPSFGSKGDRLDNGLAESQFFLFTTELTKNRHSGRNVLQVDLAKLEWACWLNNKLLRSEHDYQTPAEIEAADSPQTNPVSATARHRKTYKGHPGQFTLLKMPNYRLIEILSRRD